MDDFNEKELTEEEMANKAETEELPEPPEDTSENAEGEFEADTLGKTLVAVGSKSLINFLLKKYKFVIAIALGALGVFFIILAVITGAGVPEYEYVEPNCEQVTVIYEPYASDEEQTVVMDMEEYVKKAVYAYTEDLPSKSLYYLYSSLSIALRTEALNNSCRVTYRDKELREPNTTDVDIERALKNTIGVVMVDKNDNFINASVSDFCWSSQTEDHYQLYQNLAVPLEFAGANFSNEIYTFCPCNDEQGDPTDEENEYSMCWSSNEEDAEWLHQDETSGYSVYGAYYLAIDQSYLDDNILNYFFGDDIYLKTINKSNAKEDTKNDTSTNCSTFSITNTTLTSVEFVNKVANYNYNSSNSNRQQAWNLFVENAAKIYKMGVDNNVNPELIVVRAIVEGFSPGIAKHNYFGINCTNGQPENCSVYESFDEGIMGFIKVIQKYSSFTDLMQRYAYLGDYWFNPGGSGDGGCYYADIIYPDGLDDYVATACSDAYEGCSGSNCMATREQDHDAYATYQGKNMIDIRYDLFGISSDECTNNTLNYGNCVLYNQSDSRWGNLQLGFGSTTIGSHGCAVTSLAIALTCTGQVPNVENFTPAYLNETIKVNHGFSSDLIIWNNDGLREFVPTFTEGRSYSISKNASPEEKIKILQTVFEESNRVGIVHISNSEHYSHYVVLQSINESNNTINTLDPAGGKTQIYSINDIDGLRYYTY